MTNLIAQAAYGGGEVWTSPQENWRDAQWLGKNGKNPQINISEWISTFFFGSKYIKIESVTQPRPENNFAHFLQSIFANLQILKFFPTISIYFSVKSAQKKSQTLKL